METKTKVDCVTCGEVKAVATIIVNGQYSTWEEAVCKKCFLTSLSENPETLWVADESED